MPQPTPLSERNDREQGGVRSNSSGSIDDTPIRSDPTAEVEATPTTNPSKPRSKANAATETTKVVVASPVDAKPVEKPLYQEPFILIGTVLVLAAAGIATIVIRRSRAVKRLALDMQKNSLENVLRVHDQLRQKFLGKSDGGNIHGIGVGSAGRNEGYVVQVFVEDASKPLSDDVPLGLLPEEFRNDPIEIVEMPRAYAFANPKPCTENHGVAKNRRLIAGTGVGNSDSGHEGGTIGYFCEPNNSGVAHNSPTYILSNEHVLSILNGDINNILTCVSSPGKNVITHKLVARLEKVGKLRFAGTEKDPNRIDAAIASLNDTISHSPLINDQWPVSGHLEREAIEHGVRCKKYGATSFDTHGFVYSKHVAIWVFYSDIGVNTLFDEQILILPDNEESSFARPGDSGSLVMTHENMAFGLLFGGAETAKSIEKTDLTDVPSNFHRKIQNYGLANCISEVLKKLEVKLVIDRPTS